jgi:hypothetical protein
VIPYPDRGNVVVVFRSVWQPADDPCCPSDQTIQLFRWNGQRLVEVPK